MRVALNVAGGERVLVGVIRLLEGNPAGDELDRLIDPLPRAAALAGRRSRPAQPRRREQRPSRPGQGRDLRDPAARRPGRANSTASTCPPGSCRNSSSPTSWSEHQSTDCHPPSSSWTARPASPSPPATAPPCPAGPTTGQRARAWPRSWSGAGPARAAVVSDPDIPRCLIVAVEPARDGRAVVVRPWLNTVPGHWNPQPGDPAVHHPRRAGHRRGTERYSQGTRLWAAPARTRPGRTLCSRRRTSSSSCRTTSSTTMWPG